MAKKEKTPKKVITIEDPLIEPLFVRVEEDQYVIAKRNVTMPLRYLNSFERTMNKIIRYKTVDLLAGEVVGFEEYIEAYKAVTEQVKALFENLIDDRD